MDESETAKSLLSQFLERSSRQLNALPDLVKEKNWEEARRIAHTIKGTAKTLSGMELGNAAAVLEKAYLNIDTKKMEADLSVVAKAFERFKSASKEFLQQ